METLTEPSRSRSKREYSAGPDFSETHETESDRRKSRASKSRKHSSNYLDSLEDSRRKSSDYEEDHEGYKRESSSSHRSSRSSKRSPEERERRRDEERERRRDEEREESRGSDRREKEKSTPRHHRSDELHDSRNGKSSRDKEERYLEDERRAVESDLAVDKSENRERGSRERRRSQTPPDELDRVYSDSDHEKHDKEDDYNDENRSYKGRERGWGSERNRDSEGSRERDYWRNNRGQDRPEFNSRSGGYRKDSRARSETGKPIPGFGNRNENSDSIEIRPSRNLDFASDFEPSEDQNSSRDSQSGRYNRSNSMNPNSQNMNINSPLSNQFGPKSGRGMRGGGLGRGRPNNNNNNNNINNNNMNNNNININNSQRIGVQNLQMPMMGPPFGPLGLPPGPLGPPPVFIPPFGGPLVWPPGRGMDVNLLSNLPPIPPPIQVPPRFNPNLAPLQLPQPNNNNNNKNISNMSTPSREMTPFDKPNNNSNNNNNNTWVPNRNTGPAGKAPSRGEQNDYSQNFVDTGMRPQNFIRELELTSVVEDYPKLRELIQRKDEIVANAASPPMYFKCDLKEHVLSPEFFGTKFDVILVDPPWEEYVHRAPGITDHIEYWTMEEIMNLKLEAIADTPSFIFLWVGDGVGLEQGRQCLKKWGFRRCEDICWVKTNKKSAGPGLRHDSHTLFQHSKEHCLMGIKGTVRRSTDGHIIHANIDTDIIIAEEPSDGSTKKPEDMYRIIEHFALGKRRLELFGEDHNIRPGWLTVGKGLSSSNFNKETYTKSFADKDGKVWQGGGGRNPPPEAPHLVITTPEIESLRPKSPPAKGQQQQQQQQNPLPSLGRRNSNSANSPQNSISILAGSEPATPAHWGNNNNQMVGFELGEGSGNGGNIINSNSVFGGEGFGFGNGEFDPHRMQGLL
ncbi:hypothetical protein LUZ60_015105 [Juncus effusus]|nr:hypothetical protein LUZ60_015105 [Juncus effusus]